MVGSKAMSAASPTVPRAVGSNIPPFSSASPSPVSEYMEGSTSERAALGTPAFSMISAELGTVPVRACSAETRSFPTIGSMAPATAALPSPPA